eukprot:1141081-Pelagomonas_calceolata.AAC.2
MDGQGVRTAIGRVGGPHLICECVAKGGWVQLVRGFDFDQKADNLSFPLKGKKGFVRLRSPWLPKRHRALSKAMQPTPHVDMCTHQAVSAVTLLEALQCTYDGGC